MADLTNVVARLEAVASRLEAVAAGGGAAGAAPVEEGDVPRFVEEFDELIAEHIEPFHAAAQTIGGSVATAAGHFVDAVRAQRDFLVVVGSSKKPDDATFAALLGPTAEALGAAINVRESVARSDDAFNALSAISEGAPGLGWVQTTKPAPHAKSMGEAAEFYLNRVLKDHKEDHFKTFVRSFKAFWPALSKYCKQYHTTGPAWNAKGGDAPSSVPKSAAPAPAASSSAPDSAPPPSSSAAADTGKVKAGLFAELNQGGAVTGGLRKVTRDMTNKDKKVNSKVTTVKKAPVKKAAKKKGPAVFELQGNKWVVENHDDRQDLVIAEPKRNQTVYLYKLDNCVVQIQAKVNSICMDACTKVGLVFTDAVSVVEVINCKSVQVQVTGRVPSITVDKTSGCQVFVSEAAADVEIVSSKTDEMNIVLPPATEDGDITECPVPEQFKTTIDLATRTISVGVVEHHG
ncbi:adenylyl cyclase-associated protein [Thecamonas trahens ATCC 50062]|uniref:Adenylyl cyclase-associated protein n=1 Tax=Thecamonas trahens ATCC 50062 TaxID=461836 RepID=A0A0L0DRU3_THETB|nr:adenylyl cyclase-associated protein [Thecamonas trahens ATCC 50062]KNC54741.1 adenylyl cyclase-associated protein [Thecamonas trahens ATCC 50062]|eukprot:XP_013761641.1 adenylyl cyclase-associated protein [Thecamonas trahens ATCC 50062]